MARASIEAPRSSSLLGLAVCTILIACGISARNHVKHFRNSQTLWEYELERNPQNLHALELVGTGLVGKDPIRAIGLFQRGHERAMDNCNAALAARFALLSTKQLVGTTADTDQSQLLALRTFYDLAIEKHRLELLGPRIFLNMDLPASFASKLLGNGSLFGIPHAAVTMRTTDLARAQELTQRVLEVDPDNATAWLLLARIYARLGRYEKARATIERARQTAPANPGVEALERAVGQAMKLASEPVSTEREERLRSAQINVLLGAPEAARRALQPELDRQPGDPTLVLAYVRTMVADGRIDIAEEVIRNAERVAPENIDNWQRLRTALPQR